MNKILQRIEEAKHVVVIAHINPDADSIGSASAIYTYLLTLHKKVSFFCKTKEISNKLVFLPWADTIRDSFPASADLAISLDCGDIRRIGVDLECDLINIDHHKSNNRFGQYALVDESCISTTQVIYSLFKDNEISINKKMATALYAGILDDSNGFMDERVDGKYFDIISDLIAIGADFKLCNKHIKKSLSLGAFRIKAVMYRNMQLFKEASVAFFCVYDDDIKATGAVGQDCEYALEEALYLPNVEVSILLKQNSDYTVKGSLRSNGNIDVSKIASSLSGGGHKNRAGFNINSIISLDDAKDKILKLIYKEI